MFVDNVLFASYHDSTLYYFDLALSNGLSPEMLYEMRAALFFRVGRFPEAINDYEALVENEESEGDIYSRLALCYGALAEWNKAKKNIKKARMLSPLDQYYIEVERQIESHSISFFLPSENPRQLSQLIRKNLGQIEGIRIEIREYSG